MPEILFRGKRKDNGEWVEGKSINTQTDVNGKEHIYIGLPVKSDTFPKMITVEWVEVIPETVGQYTGLTDKNGTKIFEGDIVKTNKYGNPKRPYIIKYNCLFGAFIGVDKNDMFFTTFDGDSDYFEVIGNIHDNPELVEVK